MPTSTKTLVSDGLGLGADNLGGYFNNLFELALVIGAVLAVLIIATAGLQYMTTDAVTGKSTSKERIQQAIFGLLMLLGVWLFFNVINDRILSLNFTLQPVQVTGGNLDGTPARDTRTTRTAEPTTTTVGGLPTVIVDTPDGRRVAEYQSRIVERPTGAFPPSACGTPPEGYKYHSSYRIVAARCPQFNTDTQACCLFKAIEAE